MLDTIDALLSPLLGTLERVAWVQRHLFPPAAAQLAEQFAPGRDPLVAALRAVEEAEWPENLRFMRDRLVDVARQSVELVDAFVEASKDPNDLTGLFRALRRFVRHFSQPLARP